MTGIIDTDNLSFDDIKRDLENWVKAKPDADSWTDYYDSSAGETVIELVAGQSAYDAYRIGMVERELTLDFAQARVSFINRANMLGYPVNRPTAPILRLTITSPVEYPLWDKADPIGLLGDRKISLINSQPVGEGEITLDVYVGCWKGWESISTANDNFSRLYIEDPNVDNDLSRFFLTISNDAVPTTAYPENLDETNAHVKTTADGVFVQFGDGVDGRKLELESILLSYLSTDGRLSDGQVLPTDIRLNIGKVTSVQVLFGGHNGDSNAKIRALAPSYYSTRRSMISKKDHETMTLAYAGDLVSACAQRGEECCEVEVCYLFEDEHTMTSIEKSLLKEYLDQFKMAGENIKVVDPCRIGLDIDLTVVINEQQSDPDIYLQIKDIVEAQAMRLGRTFYVGQVVRNISVLSGVERVYLRHPASDKKLTCQEYVSLDKLDIKLTTNQGIAIQHDPDNEGYGDMDCDERPSIGGSFL